MTDRPHRTPFRVLRLGASLAAAHRPQTRPSAVPALTPELVEVRDALAEYADPVVAIRDGYVATLRCVVATNGGMGFTSSILHRSLRRLIRSGRRC